MGIVILINSILLNITTFAENYNSQAVNLNVGVNSYAAIENDCLGTMNLINPGTGLNMKAATDRRYGTDSCKIDFGYNDDTQNYAITFGNNQGQQISKSGGKEFKDIDNGTSTTISTTGNIDDEKFCYNITSATLQVGEVRIDPDTSFRFNDASAPLGYRRCFNLQDINVDPDEIVGSDPVDAAVCPYGSCYFTLNLHANMSAYELDNDYTKWGVFDKFDCTTPPCIDDYKVRLILTTPNP